MSCTLCYILTKWLKEAGYAIDFEKFEIFLLSHPDYSGLTAITDTLNEFDIENTAVQIPIEALHNLTQPFIAHIQQGHQQQFALLYPQTGETIKCYLGEKKVETITIEALKALWTGTIVVIEKKARTKKIGHRPPYFSTLVFAVLTILLTLLYTFSHPTSYSLANFILSCMGLYVCGLIVHHQLGINSGVISKFCTLGKNSDCDSVLNSKAAKFIKGIGLSDIGIVYFVSQILICLLSGSFSQATSLLLSIISLSAIPFCAYSLFLQKFIIKKWCPLCLGVVGILFIQSIISSFGISWSNLSTTNPRSVILIAVVTVFDIVIWSLLQPLLKATIALKELTIESLSFRRNYHLLLPYIDKQPVIFANFNLKNTIEIGNCLGSHQLIIVTNPLCEVCIKLHRTLEKLITADKELSVQLVFYVPLNKKDPRTIIAGHLLAQNNLGNSLAVHEWFTNPNPTFFINKNGSKLSNETTILLHRNWCHANNIFVTPTIIINGKVFPSFYRSTDIEYLLEEMLPASSITKKEEATNTVLVDNT